jgi:tetratricopeptide (TPR) repeat protein
MPPTLPLSTDPLAAMQAIATAHAESQAAFMQLLSQPSDNALRRTLHQTYREKTSRLLDLLRWHNDSGLAPSPWDLPRVAQPLVQQTLIEADIVDALGQSAEAGYLREWAVGVANTNLPPLAVGRVRRSMATQRALEGRFNEALVEFDDLRRLFGDAGDVVQAAQTVLDQSVLLEWLGDDERALAAIRDARQLVAAKLEGRKLSWAQAAEALTRETESILAGAGPTGESDEAAALLRISVELVEHEARVRKSLGDYDAAAGLFESVLPQYEALGQGAALEYQLAAIDHARGRSADAKHRLDRIAPAFAQGLLRGKLTGLRLLQGLVALGLNQPSRALTLTSEGINELQAYPDDDLAWRLQWRKAQALQALGRVDEALAAYTAAAAFVDSLRRSPLGYRLDSTALRAKLPLFEAAIELAADHGKAAECLHFIELVKARALSSVLSTPAEARARPSDLEVEFDAVTLRLDALEYRGYAGAAGGAEIQNERAGLLARRIALMEQIRLRDPRWRGLTAAPSFDAEKLAAVLTTRSQAALTLHLKGDTVRSVLVVNGTFAIGQRKLGGDVVQVLDDYGANLLRATPDPFTLDPVDLNLDAAMFVPEELLERALTSRSLLVAPHGRLHLLPWASLPFGTKRLFERTAVGVVPNLTCALVLDSEPAAAPRAAFAGASSYPGLSQIGSLPFTGLELEQAAALYKGRLVAPVLTDGDATESAVRTLAARSDAANAILHLSCHGTLSVEEPLGSGVLLVDGKIDAAEWMAMRLSYDEVVLSACSTGWRPLAAQGVALDGDDVLGLPGALLEAGARSIIVSIPKAVDEATAAFMVAYHGRRAAGQPPLAAFCETQRELLASGHQPYTWSGLVCYGVR